VRDDDWEELNHGLHVTAPIAAFDALMASRFAALRKCWLSIDFIAFSSPRAGAPQYP
jgi:hypothetical protein